MLEPFSVLLDEGVLEQYDLFSIFKMPKKIGRQILMFIPVLFSKLVRVIYINIVFGSLSVSNI